MASSSSAEEEDYRKVIEVLPKEREFRLRGIMHLQKIFKPRPEDIFLMTYPKCGTTWIKALAFSVLNRRSFSFDNHPLLTTHPQKLAASLHNPTPSSDKEWEVLPSPRLFASHIPYSLLPDSIKDDGFDCKMIYVTRDPKDAFISRYFFLKEIKQGPSISFEDVFNDFCNGYGNFGSYWDHRIEYKRESLKRPDKVMFLSYEEMKESPEDHVRRILRSFLGNLLRRKKRGKERWRR